MSEANNTAVQGKPKKKRHLWWLNLLLTLIVFAGGVILGLRLNTMPEPYALVNRYFPQLTAQSAAVSEAPATEITPAPTPSPNAAEAPKPAETLAPAEMPKAEEPETAAEPEEPEAAAEPETAAEPEEPEAAAEPETAAEPEEPEAAAEPETAAEPEEPEAAETAAEPAENAPKNSIGVDAALGAALKRAGVREEDAQVYGVFRTNDDGVAVYQVEFAADGVEYVYLVNALTAEIEGWKTVRGEPGRSLPAAEEAAPEQSAGLSAEEAKAIAIRHAGAKDVEAGNVSAELRSKGGKSWYEISFKTGVYTCTYRIDSTSGEILFYNRIK